MSRNRILGSPYEQQSGSSNFTTAPHVDRYLVDTTGGAVTVTLDPRAFNGDRVCIFDAGNDAGTNNITVEPSPGQTILGGSPNAVISVNGASLELTFSADSGGVWTVQASLDSVSGETAALLLAHGFGQNTSTDAFGPPGAILASVTVTPMVTGKFHVVATGVFATAEPPTGFVLGIGHGVSVTPDYRNPSGVTVSAINTGVTGAITMEYGSTLVPTTFPLGVPVTITLIGASGGGTVELTALGGAQITVQELPN